MPWQGGFRKFSPSLIFSRSLNGEKLGAEQLASEGRAGLELQDNGLSLPHCHT